MAVTEGDDVDREALVFSHHAPRRYGKLTDIQGDDMAVSQKIRQQLKHAQERVMAARTALGRVNLEDLEDSGLLVKFQEIRQHYKDTAAKTQDLLNLINSPPPPVGVNDEDDDDDDDDEDVEAVDGPG